MVCATQDDKGILGTRYSRIELPHSSAEALACLGAFSDICTDPGSDFSLHTSHCNRLGADK